MGFHKKHRKVGGRKKGCKNKRTIKREKQIDFVLNLLSETLESDLKKLTPKERVFLWSTMQEYRTPKLARTNINVETDRTPILYVTQEQKDLIENLD